MCRKCGNELGTQNWDKRYAPDPEAFNVHRLTPEDEPTAPRGPRPPLTRTDK
jgi:hypothetical protein